MSEILQRFAIKHEIELNCVRSIDAEFTVFLVAESKILGLED